MIDTSQVKVELNNRKTLCAMYFYKWLSDNDLDSYQKGHQIFIDLSDVDQVVSLNYLKIILKNNDTKVKCK